MCFVKNIRKIIDNAELEQCKLIFLKFFSSGLGNFKHSPRLTFWGYIFYYPEIYKKEANSEACRNKSTTENFGHILMCDHCGINHEAGLYVL